MLCGSYPPAPCGVGDYTQALARALREEGVELAIITRREPFPHDDPWVCHVSDWRWSDAPELLRQIRRLNPDVIHIEYPSRGYGWHTMITLLPALSRWACPGSARVVTLHEFRIAHPLRKAGVLALLTCSQKIITTDREETEQILRWRPSLDARITKIFIGANIPVYPGGELGPSATEAQHEHRIVYFGFLTRSKGVETLLHAFRIVRERDPEATLLMLAEVNGASAYHRRIRRKAYELGVDPWIEWAGFCGPREVSQRIRQAAVCALPFVDGISPRRSTFLTALEHQVPTVTTRGNRVPPGVRDGRNCLLVPPNNPQAVADAILRLLQDRPLRKRLAQEGMVYADSLSWREIAKQHVRVYEDLAERCTQSFKEA